MNKAPIEQPIFRYRFKAYLYFYQAKIYAGAAGSDEFPDELSRHSGVDQQYRSDIIVLYLHRGKSCTARGCPDLPGTGLIAPHEARRPVFLHLLLR
jgi:hypothetical protein